jgi:predicted alpha-1,2-mannosidase
MMKYLNYVNIKQGTKSEFRYSRGNTLPLVQRPFGMAHLAVQTKGGNAWWYDPDARYIEGLRITSQPSPWLSDYGAILISPQADIMFENYSDNWSGYRNNETEMSPHFLQTRFLRQRCTVKATVSERCIKILAEFGDIPNRAISFFNIAGNLESKVDGKNKYIYISTDGVEQGIAQNFKRYYIISPTNDCVDFEKSYVSNTAYHLMLKGETAELNIAVSYISFEQAELNLHEVVDKTFKEVMSDGEQAWEQYLSKIELDPATNEDIIRTFYSCMYRTATFPNIAYEYDENGREIHYSPYIGDVCNGIRYTNNGFWDTSRTTFPLYALIAPEIYRAMLKSALNDFSECGFLPRWVTIAEVGCMPSTLIDSVIAQGVICGIVEEKDAKILLDAMIKHAEIASNEERFGRSGIEEYKKYGYVPSDLYKESVNLTLDFAYGDYCIAKTAEFLGENKISKKYFERSKNYRNLFDEETGFMRAKKTDGEFESDFDPFAWGGAYTEASAWQTTFSVPYDFDGLAFLAGGEEKLVDMLDKIFESEPLYRVGGYKKEIHEMTEMASVNFGMCAISNQPSFSLPYIYALFDKKDRCEYWVKKICSELFSYKTDGFPGDEDNGSMSAWYILSMIGRYPICPADNNYINITPQVKFKVRNL